MASHGRRKSRGSMSIFTVDSVRSFSLSRAVSRQTQTSTPKDIGRSPSSLSFCDPNNQPPATQADLIPSRNTAGSPYNSTDALTNIHQNNQENEPVSKRFNRPMSWFPFGKGRDSPRPGYPRSFSERFRLLRGQSSTSVARSTISAPILNGTTNTIVAQTEGVHCGELTQECFDKSTWNGKLGWMANDDNVPTSPAQARPAEPLEDEQKFQLNPAARLQKIGDTVREKFRRARSSDQLKFRAIPYTSFDEAGGPVTQQTTRRKAETTNLCKSKIKALTGTTEGHARSYSTGFLGTTPKPGAEQEYPPLLHHGDNKSTIASATSATSVTSSKLSASHNHNPHNLETSSHIRPLTNTNNIETETTNMDLLRKMAANTGIKTKKTKCDEVAAAAAAATTNDPVAATGSNQINPLGMHPGAAPSAQPPTANRRSVYNFREFLEASK